MRSYVKFNEMMKMLKCIFYLMWLDLELLTKHFYDAISCKLFTKPIPGQEHAQKRGRIAPQHFGPDCVAMDHVLHEQGMHGTSRQCKKSQTYWNGHIFSPVASWTHECVLRHERAFCDRVASRINTSLFIFSGCHTNSDVTRRIKPYACPDVRANICTIYTMLCNFQ
jgi:hypothetical protein